LPASEQPYKEKTVEWITRLPGRKATRNRREICPW
jgi:hypothetical protein